MSAAAPRARKGAILAACVLLYSLAASPAASQGAAAPPDRAPSVATDILFVRNVGAWRRDRPENHARLLMTRVEGEPGAVRLHVEWLGRDPRSGRVTRLAIVETPEMFDWRIDVKDYYVVPQDDHVLVVLEAQGGRQGAPVQYDLVIREPGDARLARRTR